MAEFRASVNRDTELANGTCSLEAKLGRLFAEQRRLREQLEQTRAELDRINAEVLQTQDGYCTSPEREEEYFQCLKRVLGYDPRDILKDIEEAKENPVSFSDLIAELERIGES